MKAGIILIALALLLAVAIVVEIIIRRKQPRRPLADSRPEMPEAKRNLGLGFDTEWRPKPQFDPENPKDHQR